MRTRMKSSNISDSNVKFVVPTGYWASFMRKIFGLKEVSPDADGLYNGAILPKSQSNVLWYSSWLFLASGIYGYSRNYIELSLAPFLVFFTSILYWKHPDYSYRRYVDVITVNTGVVYIALRARHCENRMMYYPLLVISCLCFYLGYYFKKKSTWISTFFHMLLHIFGNLAFVVIAMGSTTPFDLHLLFHEIFNRQNSRLNDMNSM